MRSSRAASFICTLFIAASLSGCVPKKQLHISDFTAALAAKGIPVEGQSQMFYTMVSAHDGASVKIAGHSVEIYEYDMTVKSGKDAHDKLAAEGLMGQRMIANANLLLLEDTKNPRWTDIKKVFESL